MAGIGRSKKKYLYKTLFLILVFVLALTGYFVWSFFNTEKEYTVYTSMEEPTLPVVYTSVYGKEINCMHGYLQDMGNEAAADCITVLPQNRRLELRIAEYNNMVAGVSYEIRSLDQEHFIEKTTVDELRRENGNLYVTLPIQNMIEKNTQYLLSISLDTGEKTVNFYTRIIWTDNDYANQMISFAGAFAEKTFDYNTARDLTMYLETNAVTDNSNLGEVSIKSNFSQLTWAGTGMQLATDIAVTLKEFDGIMGAVELNYMVTRVNELGNTERYQVTDMYTMRMGSDRIYLMDYERRTNQIFEGNKHLFSGNRIILGITNEDMLQAEKSGNGQFLAFTANRELWVYDQKHKHAENIFSFRSGVDDGTRANYEKHDIKILSVEDSGDIDFIVYGYMNRGRHEGYNGIVYYHYSKSTDTIIERFFIPQAKIYDKIALEVSELAVKSANDMFYLKQNDSIVAIELHSLEMLDIAAGLTDGSYAISKDQTKVAWQDGGLYDSRKIQFMDVISGTTQTITAAPEEYLRVLGFMEQDLVYGRAGINDHWIVSNCVRGLPMYQLEIVSDKLAMRKEYRRDGIFISDVKIEGNRIHLMQVQKNSEQDPNHAYLETAGDTIVYQDTEEEGALSLVRSYDSTDRKRIYYVVLDEEIKTTRSLKVSVPRKISYEKAGSIELLKPQKNRGGMQFYVYSRGRITGKTENFTKAVQSCYDSFGWVKDADSNMLYNRTDRESARNLGSPKELSAGFEKYLAEFSGSRKYDDGWILLNAQGLNLNQVLYYVYQGTPVAAYLEDMQYYLIYGYDNFNIRFYNPQAESEEESTVIMGKNDAEAFLTEHQNDYVCAVYAED